MAKLGKDMPDKFNRPARDGGEPPAVKDPEELKRLHEEMIAKQKEFISHRKEVENFTL